MSQNPLPLNRRQAGLLTLALLGTAAPLPGMTQPVTPSALQAPTGYQLNPYTATVRGWAAGTRGGQGGRILRVTTLAAAGPGSLREALEAEGPRLVVFEVGGVIDANGQDFAIKHPYVTVAGQTAPSPGITVIKAETVISTHDVVVQHLSFRPGEFGRAKQSGHDQDGISTVGGAYNVIVDHCSFSWATDENLSASGPRFEGATPDDWRQATSHQVTYSHNLIYEGLSHSVHVKGEHSKGSLIHDNTSGILLLGNVYASNRERNALFKGGARGAMVNNLIYNPGRRAVHYNLLANEWAGQPYQRGRVTLLGNVYRQGPDTVPGLALFTVGGDGDVDFHALDNLALDRQGQALPESATGNGAARILRSGAAYLPPDVQAVPAAQLEAELLRVAGARPWDRDPLDRQLLAQVAGRGGKIIDSELENALGYPAHAVTRRPFDPEAWHLDAVRPKAGWAALAGDTRPVVAPAAPRP